MSLRIAITGSGGLVGRRIQAEFPEAEFVPLVRSRDREGIYWQPLGNEIDAAKLEGFDAVIHLAGEPIIGRWTDQKRKAIHESRSLGTRLLAEALAGLERKPKVLLSASAIGLYGDTGEHAAIESDPAGTGFLPEVCTAWEAATEPAESAGIRVCHMRIGIVIDRAGGALKQMLLPFKLGLGGRIASGKQYMSWISNDDIAGAARFLLENDRCAGAYNLTGPEPATNLAFTKTLGKVLKRPTIFPVPAFGLRLLYGAMSDALLLASLRVVPARLLEAGYTFREPELERCLRKALTTPTPSSTSRA